MDTWTSDAQPWTLMDLRLPKFENYRPVASSIIGKKLRLREGRNTCRGANNTTSIGRAEVYKLDN
jgi:hypothetical protein